MRPKRLDDLVKRHEARLKVRERGFAPQLLAVERLVGVAATGDTGDLLDSDEKSTHLLLFGDGYL